MIVLSFPDQIYCIADNMSVLPFLYQIYYTADNTVRGRLSLEEVQFYVNSWPDPACVVLVSPAQHGEVIHHVLSSLGPVRWLIARLVRL